MRSSGPVTDFERQKIVRLYEEYRSLDRVAREVHRATSTVSRCLREAGVVVERRYRFNVAQELAIVQLYEAGFSFRKIGELYENTHPSTIRAILKRHGVEFRPPYGYQQRGVSRISHKQINLARFLYEHKRMSTVEIARTMGRSESAVRRYIRLAGVQRRSHSQAVREGIAKAQA